MVRAPGAKSRRSHRRDMQVNAVRLIMYRPAGEAKRQLVGRAGKKLGFSKNFFLDFRFCLGF